MSDEERAIKGWINLWKIINEFPGGDVSMIRPDGTVLGPLDSGGASPGPGAFPLTAMTMSGLEAPRA
ncbi:MAG: hypothetical protein V2J55_15275, partial [Candidatus Competibacteraceae bacterium]|nr:hypothetical protein [Candidatus Competibacteraceae bacterium]